MLAEIWLPAPRLVASLLAWQLTNKIFNQWWIKKYSVNCYAVIPTSLAVALSLQHVTLLMFFITFSLEFYQYSHKKILVAVGSPVTTLYTKLTTLWQSFRVIEQLHVTSACEDGSTMHCINSPVVQCVQLVNNVPYPEIWAKNRHPLINLLTMSYLHLFQILLNSTGFSDDVTYYAWRNCVSSDS